MRPGSMLLAFALLAVSGAATVAAATPMPNPSATLPTPPPLPYPTITPSPVPSPVPTPSYKFVYRATPSPVTTPFPGPNVPQIDEIDLSDSTLVPPAQVRARVLTSSNVVSVVAATLGQSLALGRQRAGVFVLDASVPDVPNFLRNRSFDVTFTATAPGGRTADVTLQLTIQ